jgi:hypothetical protein
MSDQPTAPPTDPTAPDAASDTPAADAAAPADAPAEAPAPDILAADALGVEPPEEPSGALMVQCYTIACGYHAATISEEGDLDAPHDAERVRMRLLAAADPERLQAIVLAVLLDTFGLSADAAQAAWESASLLRAVEAAPVRSPPYQRAEAEWERPEAAGDSATGLGSGRNGWPG